MQYGLISVLDGKTIEKTLDLIIKEFTNDEFINTCEVGVYNGETSRGIHEYIVSKNKGNWHTAIDNSKYFEVQVPFIQCTFIKGNSNEVYNQLEDNSQHFIFIDGCHAFPMVISDFYCYEGKVKVGGYLAFHDTGKHIQHTMTGYQDMGSKTDPDMYVSVRKALDRIGLLGVYTFKWKLLFDEADDKDEFGGICVFKKIF